MIDSALVRGVCAVACAAWISLCAVPAQAQDEGRLKICKQGEAENWTKPEVWRRDIVVPKGAIFEDVGPIKGQASIEDWWRLSVETLAVVTIRRREKCVTVPAKISSRDEDWGRIREVKPLVTSVTPEDGRLFAIVRFAFPLERKIMAPWADVVPVEATIESAMKR